MVVHHADSLHVRVDHGGSDEAESPPLQIATERVRLWRRRGNLTHGFPSTLSRPAVDESPVISVEAPVFFLHRQKRSRVLHRRGDLRAIPDDRGSAVSFSIRASEYRATFSGSKSLNARR